MRGEDDLSKNHVASRSCFLAPSCQRVFMNDILLTMMLWDIFFLTAVELNISCNEESPGVILELICFCLQLSVALWKALGLAGLGCDQNYRVLLGDWKTVKKTET